MESIIIIMVLVVVVCDSVKVDRCKDLLRYEPNCVKEMDRSVCVRGNGWTFDDGVIAKVGRVREFAENIVSLEIDSELVEFEAKSVDVLLQMLCLEFLERGSLEIPTRRRLAAADEYERQTIRSEAATVLALMTGLIFMGIPLFWMFLLSAEIF
jgi:hypothetical protein